MILSVIFRARAALEKLPRLDLRASRISSFSTASRASCRLEVRVVPELSAVCRVGGQVVGVDHVVGGQEDPPFHDIFQLADIPGQ
jgi:hypothetical protein